MPPAGKRRWPISVSSSPPSGSKRVGCRCFSTNPPTPAALASTADPSTTRLLTIASRLPCPPGTRKRSAVGQECVHASGGVHGAHVACIAVGCG